MLFVIKVYKNLPFNQCSVSDYKRSGAGTHIAISRISSTWQDPT